MGTFALVMAVFLGVLFWVKHTVKESRRVQRASAPGAPCVAMWRWSLEGVLLIKRTTLYFPVPLDLARQRLTEAATSPLVVGNAFVPHQPKYHHYYDAVVREDSITIEGPRRSEYMRTPRPLSVQGVLFATSTGSALQLASRPRSGSPLVVFGFVVALSIIVGIVWIGPRIVVGSVPWWTGPVIGSLVSSSIFFCVYGLYVFAFKYASQVLFDQCGRTILGIPPVDIR
jgi:hypothetical protein